MPTKKPSKGDEPKPKSAAPDKSDSQELSDDELKSVSGGLSSLGVEGLKPPCISKL